MTDVKAQELSHDEWYELLEPYGWADITVRWAAASRNPFDYVIRMELKPGPGGELDEWAERSYLLEQARQAVQAVQAKGYVLEGAPRIEFGGQYTYRIGAGPVPAWSPEARLDFSVAVR
jgi:hypothetical protein